jgi:hypothetical protein
VEFADKIPTYDAKSRTTNVVNNVTVPFLFLFIALPTRQVLCEVANGQHGVLGELQGNVEDSDSSDSWVIKNDEHVRCLLCDQRRKMCSVWGIKLGVDDPPPPPPPCCHLEVGNTVCG